MTCGSDDLARNHRILIDRINCAESMIAVAVAAPSHKVREDTCSTSHVDCSRISARAPSGSTTQCQQSAHQSAYGVHGTSSALFRVSAVLGCGIRLPQVFGMH